MRKFAIWCVCIASVAIGWAVYILNPADNTADAQTPAPATIVKPAKVEVGPVCRCGPGCACQKDAAAVIAGLESQVADLEQKLASVYRPGHVVTHPAGQYELKWVWQPAKAQATDKPRAVRIAPPQLNTCPGGNCGTVQRRGFLGGW